MAFVTGLLATACILCLAQTTNAQIFLEIEDDTVAVIDTANYVDFHFNVRNNTFGEQRIFVRRVVEDIPQDWASTICMEDFCYSFEDDSTGQEAVVMGGTYKVKLTVYSGYEMNENATLKFEFYAVEIGSVVKFGEVTLNVATGLETSAPIDVAGALLPYPNPASEAITIPLDEMSSGTLKIFDATGRVVREHSIENITDGRLSLPVGDLTVGAYGFTFTTSDAVRRGRFVVAR